MTLVWASVLSLEPGVKQDIQPRARVLRSLGTTEARYPGLSVSRESPQIGFLPSPPSVPRGIFSPPEGRDRLGMKRNQRVRVSDNGIELDRWRYCARCDRSLPRELFGRDASKASGLKSICKECDRAKARAYYERERQARKGTSSRGSTLTPLAVLGGGPLNGARPRATSSSICGRTCRLGFFPCGRSRECRCRDACPSRSGGRGQVCRSRGRCSRR